MPIFTKHVRRDLKSIFSSHVTHLILLLLLLLIVSPFIIAISLNVKPAKNIEYGVTFSAPYATSFGFDWKEVYLAVLDDLKVNNLRLIAYWDDIEKDEGKYDFSDLKFQLDEAKKRNVNVILAIGRKVPRWPECHEPEWIKDREDKKIEEALLTLLNKEVNEFKGYENIKMWQVENEPFFPFGECEVPTWDFVKKEVSVVKALDPKRPVVVQDSGEGGFWLPSYLLGDNLGISMYRRIWYDFWGVFLGKHIFFTYPLSYWSYPLKARIVGIPLEKILVLELQAEPWGDDSPNKLSSEIKDKTMSKDKFLETISYAQKTGINSFYFWGVEWWYWEKAKNNNPFFWETAKAFWK